MMAVDPVSLPFWLQRGTAFVIFAAAIFVIAAHTGHRRRCRATYVLEDQDCSPVRCRRLLRRLAGHRHCRWRWNELSHFAGITSPAQWSRRMIPFITAVIALFASRAIRAINAATPNAWLIGIQTYRVAGIMFVFLFSPMESYLPDSPGRRELAMHLREF